MRPRSGCHCLTGGVPRSGVLTAGAAGHFGGQACREALLDCAVSLLWPEPAGTRAGGLAS